jgi:mannose-1-phosphate guanylyltransferase/phosphomannomutase
VPHHQPVIGDGCQIGDGVTLVNAVVWSNVSMGAGATAKECVIASGVDVQEKASIYEGVTVSDNCTIGREAVLKAGVKVWPSKVVEDGAQLSTALCGATNGPAPSSVSSA